MKETRLSRLRAFIQRYFAPKTLEQSLGLGYLIMAVSMVHRPFLAGLENLNLQYGLPLLDPRVVGALLALFALILLIKKRCGRRLFAALYFPLPIYAVCLAFFYLNGARVGLAGTLAFIGLSICIARMYSLRASLREQEALYGRA